ncbi:MAG: nitroreductase family protein [Anaerolineae bacterium]|nr:nitroreductase family protein [Anaerolineae bacterium]
MVFTQAVTEIIRRRYSCRRYLDTPIEEQTRRQLDSLIAATATAPFSPTAARFMLAAATEQDRLDLKGLGTYGLIRNPTGFIIGAVGPGDKNLEAFGYLMERIVLFATDLGLGTCWVGGVFTRSGFARRIGIKGRETIPAIVTTGYAADAGGLGDPIRRMAGSDRRLPWEQVFFDARWGIPLSPEAAGAYAEALEMVRLGPSASNKQPWRVVHETGRWHFYLQRTPRYPAGGLGKLIGVTDLQRVDLGIAMCHLELTAAELGLAGQWQVDDPGLELPVDLTEYTATWAGG